MTKLTERSPDNRSNNIIKKKEEETNMKKVLRNRTTSRIVSFLLAVMIMIMPLAGCMNNQEQKSEFLDTVNQTTSASTTQKVETPNTGSIAGEKDSTEADTELQKQLDEALAKLETLEKEKAEAEKKAAEAIEESKKAEAEVTKLEAENASLKEQGKLPVEVVDGKIFVNLEYAIDDMTVKFNDGTAALMATEKGIEVIVDFDEAIGSKTIYRDNYIALPREDYSYAVTYDGKTVYKVNTGKSGQEYSYANGGLFIGSKMATGYKIQDTQLRGSFGTTDDLLQVVIVAIEDSSAEYGYRFRVKAGNYSPNASIKPSNPGTSQKPSNPQPSNPTHTCPTPEKETVTKLVCKVCGMEDCPGHCGKCHAPIPYCSCKPDTVIIVKCPTCGLVNCPGHKETVYVPGETIEVCNKCKNPIEDCTCKNDSNPGCNHQHGCTCGNCGNCQPKPGCDHQHGCTCGNCGNCQPKPEHNQRPPAHNDQVFDSDESKNDTGVKDENKDHSQKPNDGNQGNNETGKPSDDGQDEIPDLTLNPEEPRNDILSRKNSSESTADKNLSVEIVSTENTSGENIQQENQQQISKSPSTALHSDRPLD